MFAMRAADFEGLIIPERLAWNNGARLDCQARRLFSNSNRRRNRRQTFDRAFR
jgi:hypothetical protein